MFHNGLKKSHVAVSLLLCFVLIVHLQEWIKHFVWSSWAIGYLDEGVAILAYIMAAFLVRKEGDAWMLAVLCFSLFSVGYTLIYNWNFAPDLRAYETIVQSLINIKLFLYGVLLVFLTRQWIGGKHVLFVFNAIFLLCILGVVANFVYPSEFVYSKYQYAFDRNRIVGFQYKPNDLALFVSFYFSYLLFLKRVSTGRVILLVTCVVIVLATTSRTALIVMVGAVCLLLYHKRSPLSLVTLSFSVVLLFLLFWDMLSGSFIVNETIRNFSEFSDITNSEYIRFIMVYYSAILAADNFPMGVGAGNYGTVMSEGGFVYQDLGLANMTFFVKMEGIFDSNMASLLGEYGVLGIVLYYYFLISLLKALEVDSRLLLVFLVSMAFTVSFTQPFFSYQVNAVGFLLMVASISYAMRKGDLIFTSGEPN